MDHSTAKVLVVSRNSAIADRLACPDYDVAELAPPALRSWIESGEKVDAVILDLETPELTSAALNELRQHDKLPPVLVVSNDAPGWDAEDFKALPAVDVLTLPINRSGLIAAVRGALGVRREREASAVAANLLEELRRARAEHDSVRLSTGPQHEHVDEALRELAFEPVDLLSEEEDLELTFTDPPGVMEARHDGDAHAEPSLDDLSASTPPAVQDRSTDPGKPTKPAVAPTPRPLRNEPPREPDKSITRPPGRRRPRSPSMKSLKDSVAPPGEPTPDDAVTLVRRLLPLLDSLIGVPEAAGRVISNAVVRSSAGAGAILIPDDDDAWRVAAGVGLRPLEHRYELTVDSWLVQKVVRGGQGVIVEESDIARQLLRGAPLSSWRHLIAAPIPEVKTLLLLARSEDPPFDEADLRTLVRVGKDAMPELMRAVETRSLARALSAFRDLRARGREP